MKLIRIKLSYYTNDIEDFYYDQRDESLTDKNPQDTHSDEEESAAEPCDTTINAEGASTKDIPEELEALSEEHSDVDVQSNVQTPDEEGNLNGAEMTSCSNDKFPSREIPFREIPLKNRKCVPKGIQCDELRYENEEVGEIQRESNPDKKGEKTNKVSQIRKLYPFLLIGQALEKIVQKSSPSKRLREQKAKQ